MGRKEWLYWGGGGGGGAGAGKSRKGSSTTTANHPPPPSSSSSGGCMSAIFQLFDLHQFQFQQNPFIPSDPNNLFTNITPDEELPNTHIVLKGVEAPRNSLEMEELASSSSCSPSSSSPPEIKLDIPMGIQIKTGRSRLLASSDECNSSLSCSPGTKTPSLVARLMGLDLLPDQISSPRPSSSSNYSTTTPNLKSSSSSSSSHHHHHHHRHSRSLPETPRVSTASGRRSTDTTDYHHRLSLQIPDKENHYHTFNSPTTTTTTTRGGEETSHYAKQILKQVRENVSMRRSVGADITNTVMTNRKKEQRRDENLVVLLKSKKPSSSSSSSSVDDHINHQPTPLSCSPRLRFLENKNKPTSVPPSNINISAPLPIINEVKGPSPKAPKSQPPLMAKEKPMQKQQKLQEEDKLVKKCKKIASERYDVRVKKLHQHQQKKKKQEEPFVKLTFGDKKSKKPSSTTPTPLMPNTKFLSFKKNPSQKQVPHESITQLPRSQSQSYSSKATPTLTVRDDHDLNAAAISTTTAAKAAVGFEYISRILNYIGIYENTPISTTHWHSPSHPLNPSIFHHLELSSHTLTTQRSERKLMFELVNEILVDIVKPYIDFRPWVRCGSRKVCNGHQLFEEMCKRVTSFPGADCKVLEDIDAVIDADLGRGSTREQRKMSLEEEAERIIMEIEGDIVEKLVHETLMW